MGEKGCNLQLVKLEKYSIQGFNSSKQYRIWLVVSTHLKNISQTGHLPQIGVKIKNLWNHHLGSSAEIHLDISECKATKCKPCSPPSSPMLFHDKSMFFTVVLTFNASARACGKRCQIMSNLRAYNAICANIQPRVFATIGNPRKSMNLIIHSQQTEGFADLFGSFIVLWLPNFKEKTHLPHSSISWWFQPNCKICLSNWIISPGRGKNKKSLKPPNSQLLMQLYIHHRSFTVKIRHFPIGTRALFRGKLAVKLWGGILKHLQYWG